MASKCKCSTEKKSVLEEAVDASKKAVEDFGKIAEMVGDFIPGVAKDAAGMAKTTGAGGARQALQMQRRIFQSALSVFDTVQKQAGKVIEKNLAGNENLPEEAREVVKEWTRVIKTGRNEMTGAVEKSFDLIDQYLSKVQKSDKVKAAPKKAAAKKASTKVPAKKAAVKKAPAKKTAVKKAAAK